MANFQIKYHTENKYEIPVHEAYLELMILPCSNENQHCLSFDISNNLMAPVKFVDSMYGFQIARFHLFGSILQFDLTLHANVEINSFINNNYKNISIKEEARILEMIETKVEFSDFLVQTPLTKIETSKYPFETFKHATETVFQFVQRINNYVYIYIRYEQGVTTVTSTAADALLMQQGVCQDYAHFFISIMRANAIPARYVSGYLNQNGMFVGDSAMHAWVEVWLPGSGWMGIDPTNNLFVNENYLKVAHGSDYTDCMPLKGILRSGGNSNTKYIVEVTEQQNQ